MYIIFNPLFVLFVKFVKRCTLGWKTRDLDVKLCFLKEDKVGLVPGGAETVSMSRRATTS